ncbi:MAG: VWA domain-containing protein [Candidatus Thiodiazotropha lotti]|nr:VWA domain-containing protein [Candidatus Thiodiazotropha lotti]
MKPLKLYTAIGALCAGWLIAAPLPATGAGISITSRTQNPAPKIVLRSKFDFEKSISLKVRTDPRFLPSDVLIKTVSEIGMVDANGVRIVSGFDIDVENDLVVAFSGGTSEIIRTSRTPQGLQIITSFKDASGNFVSPPADSLALYSVGGTRLCFDYKTIAQSTQKIAIALRLDRSGSMAGNIETVKKTAQEFLNILPSTAECGVASFDTQVTFTQKNYQSCNGGGFGIETIEAGGGTDIYTALKLAYSDLSQSYFDGFQKAVIVITDGYTMSDPALKQELLGLKKDILTFVYFIGGDKKDDLEELTDHFIAQGGDIEHYLSQYLGALGQAYNTQKVLSVKACPGGGHANP